MNEITIREATLDDLETLVEFNVLMAAETENLKLDVATVSGGARAVLEDPSKGAYYLAERANDSGERVVAGQLMITYEWSDWRNGLFLWIQSVFVAEGHRRQGVFRALYRHIEERAASPGHCGVRLYVHDHNDDAEETYLRLGMVSPGYRVLETPDALRDGEAS
jgi:GNAT superfamily N-acetyltransferase